MYTPPKKHVHVSTSARKSASFTCSKGAMRLKPAQRSQTMRPLLVGTAGNGETDSAAKNPD